MFRRGNRGSNTKELDVNNKVTFFSIILSKKIDIIFIVETIHKHAVQGALAPVALTMQVIQERSRQVGRCPPC